MTVVVTRCSDSGVGWQVVVTVISGGPVSELGVESESNERLIEDIEIRGVQSLKPDPTGVKIDPTRRPIFKNN